LQKQKDDLLKAERKKIAEANVARYMKPKEYDVFRQQKRFQL